MFAAPFGNALHMSVMAIGFGLSLLPCLLVLVLQTAGGCGMSDQQVKDLRLAL